MDSDILKNDMKALLSATLSESGLDLSESVDAVAAYAAQRAAHLSTLVALPGFQEAVIAERDNVALRAGIAASAAGKTAEAKLLGVLQGALAIAARSLIPV